MVPRINSLNSPLREPAAGRRAPRKMQVSEDAHMTPQERQIIESLFARVRLVAEQTGPRDPEADAVIRAQLERNPGAAYYLAQTVLAQEQALEAAQARITALEREVYSRGGGGFLEPLGSGRSHRSTLHESYRAGSVTIPSGRDYGYGAAKRPQASASSSFLAGAAQTAIGMCGGSLAAILIASAAPLDE